MSDLQRLCDTCHARGEAIAGVIYCEDCCRVMCERHKEVSRHFQRTGN